MSISLNGGLALNKTEPDFTRLQWNTVKSLAMASSKFPDIYDAFVISNGKKYRYQKSNESVTFDKTKDEEYFKTLDAFGKWRKLYDDEEGGAIKQLTYEEMEAVAEETYVLGDVYQYSGESNEKYIHGAFYEVANLTIKPSKTIFSSFKTEDDTEQYKISGKVTDFDINELATGKSVDIYEYSSTKASPVIVDTSTWIKHVIGLDTYYERVAIKQNDGTYLPNSIDLVVLKITKSDNISKILYRVPEDDVVTPVISQKGWRPLRSMGKGMQIAKNDQDMYQAETDGFEHDLIRYVPDSTRLDRIADGENMLEATYSPDTVYELKQCSYSSKIIPTHKLYHGNLWFVCDESYEQMGDYTHYGNRCAGTLRNISYTYLKEIKERTGTITINDFEAYRDWNWFLKVNYASHTAKVDPNNNYKFFNTSEYHDEGYFPIAYKDEVIWEFTSMEDATTHGSSSNVINHPVVSFSRKEIIKIIDDSTGDFIDVDPSYDPNCMTTWMDPRTSTLRYVKTESQTDNTVIIRLVMQTDNDIVNYAGATSYWETVFDDGYSINDIYETSRSWTSLYSPVFASYNDESYSNFKNNQYFFNNRNDKIYAAITSNSTSEIIHGYTMLKSDSTGVPIIPEETVYIDQNSIMTILWNGGEIIGDEHDIFIYDNITFDPDKSTNNTIYGNRLFDLVEVPKTVTDPDDPTKVLLEYKDYTRSLYSMLTVGSGEDEIYIPCIKTIVTNKKYTVDTTVTPHTASLVIADSTTPDNQRIYDEESGNWYKTDVQDFTSAEATITYLNVHPGEDVFTDRAIIQNLVSTDITSEAIMTPTPRRAIMSFYTRDYTDRKTYYSSEKNQKTILEDDLTVFAREDDDSVNIHANAFYKCTVPTNGDDPYWTYIDDLKTDNPQPASSNVGTNFIYVGDRNSDYEHGITYTYVEKVTPTEITKPCVTIELLDNNVVQNGAYYDVELKNTEKDRIEIYKQPVSGKTDVYKYIQAVAQYDTEATRDEIITQLKEKIQAAADSITQPAVIEEGRLIATNSEYDFTFGSNIFYSEINPTTGVGEITEDPDISVRYVKVYVTFVNEKNDAGDPIVRKYIIGDIVNGVLAGNYWIMLEDILKL